MISENLQRLQNSNTRIKANVANAYSKAEAKGATLPIVQNSENLAGTIDSIMSGGESEYNVKMNTINESIMRSIKKISGPVTIIGTSCSNLFSDCLVLTAIPELNTSNVINMNRMFFNCNSLLEIPQLDTSKVTSMNHMFYSCTSLTTVPELNTPNVTDMASMFLNCTSLTTVPQLDTSNVTNVEAMFSACKKIITIPELNIPKATNMRNMFNACYLLTEVSLLNTSNVIDMHRMFQDDGVLAKISELDASKVINIQFMFHGLRELTNFKGLKNLGKAYTATQTNKAEYTLDLIWCSKLTHESAVNILNNLYDLNLTYNVANGGTLYTQSVIFHSNVKAVLTPEEIAIATPKGWTVA